MGWYALEEIQNAVDDTKELLLPFNWKTWAKIALLSIFVGSSGMGNLPMPSGSSGPSTDLGQTGTSYSAPMESFTNGGFESITGMATGSGESMMVLGVLAVVIPLLLVFMVIGAVFKFVLYQSLMDTDVQIRKNVDRHFGKGLRFLGAGLLVTGTLLAAIIGVAAIATISPIIGALTILAAIPIMVVFGIALKLFNEFIPLKMIERDSGVIDATKSFYVDFKEEWKQVMIYILVSIGVAIGTGIVGMIGVVVTALAVLLPLGVVAFVLGTVSEILMGVVIAVAVLIWIVSLVYFVSGPITTFMHYYVIRVFYRLTA